MRAAAGGNAALREIYEECRAALTDRIFTSDAQGQVVADTPVNRLLVRGWSAMAEELVLTWVADPGGVSREDLVALLAGSLPALVGSAHDPDRS